MVRDTKFPTRLLLASVGVGAGIGAVISVASSGLAVYFARKIVVPENAPEELEILHIDGFPPNMRIHLPADEETTVRGTYGLYFNQGTGHAVIGDIVEYDPRSRTVSREILSVTRGDIKRASHGRWTGIVYPEPLAAGVNAEDIEIESDAGRLPAWLLPTDHPEPHDTWAILVHGRASTRAEGLRAAPILNTLGVPAIAMSYRNDAEVRVETTSRYGLGDTEWIDVDAAIDFAVSQGAHDVVLFGWSMGGAIALQAASRGRNRRYVKALVLDGPVVDWVNVLDGQARRNMLPTPIAKLTLEMITQPWARPITGLQTPLDLGRLDWVTRAAELDVPVLLIHSDDDEFVPSSPSHALASVRRDLVTMPVYDKARHTKEWNIDPVRWEDDVANFLEAKILPKV
ncbi:alpha/beta hydrolase [Brevibacterium aurantiacum]|uniref:Lysophospholipase n=1 Tax=Brevibacterium aurantiacum TaxID=273384 RepID=A0A556CKX0_BREAU|nr:alpha/beta fold hydrolase [Brevibacterium aurantiacum]TSI17956.1 lysophospholipase [Brevibacterium aurantiacum]